VGKPEVFQDPRYATANARSRHIVELYAMVEATVPDGRLQASVGQAYRQWSSTATHDHRLCRQQLPISCSVQQQAQTGN
jgi:hypothetical protein